jgi:hypothetical protein
LPSATRALISCADRASLPDCDKGRGGPPAISGPGLTGPLGGGAVGVGAEAGAVLGG